MPFAHGHALLIGVGAYQHMPGLSLPLAADARAVAQVLRDPRFCGYSDSQVALLHDTRAASAGILAALDQLAARAGAGDTVVLFYAGRGDFGDDGDYYLAGYDTRMDGGKIVGATGIGQKALLEKLAAIQARQALLIFNIGYSSASGADSPEGRGLPAETASALLATGAGRMIITPSRAAQRAYAGAGKLTPFTQALVGGLLGQGVGGRGGSISAFELYSHVYTAVRRQVEQELGTLQEPELTILKGAGTFAVASYHGAAAGGTIDEWADPAPGSAVRSIGDEESRRALERVIGAGQGVAVGGEVSGGAIAGRDQVDAHGSQGYIGRAAGPIAQNFGSQQTTDTGGGAAISGNQIEQGNIIAGGEFSGPVIGGVSGGTVVSTGGGDYSYINTGGGDLAAAGDIDKRRGDTIIADTVNIDLDALLDSALGPRAGGAQPPLEQALEQSRQTANQARQRGDDDLADDLQSLILALEAALKAERAGRSDRRSAKLGEARAVLDRLAPGRPELRELAEALKAH
jgi:hypothetical protein